MRKSRKVKRVLAGESLAIAGKISCLWLVALGLVSASPTTVTGVYAMETGSDETELRGETGSSEDFAEVADEQNVDGIGSDASVMATAADAGATIPSTVSISFSPTAASGSMTLTTLHGAKARADVTATVRVQNSGGYSVYLGASNPNLVRSGGTEMIVPVSGSVEYDNLPANTWGYAYSANGAVGNNAVYSAVSTVGNGAKLDENKNSQIMSETKTFGLSFAAHIDNDKPAGVYSTRVTMSVISSPRELVLADITNLQQMTASVCENTPTEPAAGSSKQLRDTRDNKYYWVTKLKDGKCWMTQNLDLDLSTSKALTPSDSDVTVNWTPGFNTATQATSSTVNSKSHIETRSWSLGNYRITNPSASSDCGHPKNSLSQCTAQFTAQNTPTSADGDINAHYIVGNHYQWNAATAGTGGVITAGQATSSICPMGWKLPVSNATGVGTFASLLEAYGIKEPYAASMMTQLTSAPLYFVRGSDVNQTANYLFNGAGDFASYWSSTPLSSDEDAAYALIFSSTDDINPSGRDTRNLGLAVRCIAK